MREGDLGEEWGEGIWGEEGEGRRVSGGDLGEEGEEGIWGEEGEVRGFGGGG